MRALILVLDSVGIGAAPDAAAYGDAGSNTLGHIAEYCAKGHADSACRAGVLKLPNLVRLGLGEACRLASGAVPVGLETRAAPIGRYPSAIEMSKGKDTPSGHWELAGVPVSFAWGYFPDTQPCFPSTLIDELCRLADLPGILGDRHASGTHIIAELGEEHMRSGKPICYSSADSVFQIAAHEESFGLDRLYTVCAIAHELMAPFKIGRVIARPFTGSSPDPFIRRTAGHRDYSVPPPRQLCLTVRPMPDAILLRSEKSPTSSLIREPAASSKATAMMRCSTRHCEACPLWPTAACCLRTSSISICSTDIGATSPAMPLRLNLSTGGFPNCSASSDKTIC